MASPPIEDREYAATIPLKLNDIHDEIMYAVESSELKVQRSYPDGGAAWMSAGKSRSRAGIRELKNGRAA